MINQLLDLATLLALHRRPAPTPDGAPTPVQLVPPVMSTRPARCSAFWFLFPFWLYVAVRDRRNGARDLYGRGRSAAEAALNSWSPEDGRTVASTDRTGAVAVAHVPRADSEAACLADLAQVLAEGGARSAALVFPASLSTGDMVLLIVTARGAHAFAARAAELAAGPTRPTPRPLRELRPLADAARAAVQAGGTRV